MLPNGDMTEVGERVRIFQLSRLLLTAFYQGISLSGGQKQRLSICRTIYLETEIQIFDVCFHFVVIIYTLTDFRELVSFRTLSLHSMPMSANPSFKTSSNNLYLEKRGFLSLTPSTSYLMLTSSMSSPMDVWPNKGLTLT